MKHIKPFLSFVTVLLVSNAFSQIGVNTTTPHAQLEIAASSQSSPTGIDGLIIPKVDVFPSSGLTSDQQSMLVYLTTAVGTDQPGFYYYDHPTTSWKPVGGTSDWSLTGNSGTSAGTNFLGTIDDNDLIFKRNATIAGGIGTSNTTFGLNSMAISTGSNNTAVGKNALSDNTTGLQNSAFGNTALGDNTTGSRNVAVGGRSMEDNDVGVNNTAVGYLALATNNSGGQNVAIGSNALDHNTEGLYNTITGTSSTTANTTGNHNSAYGFATLTSNTTSGYNSVFGSYADIAPGVQNATAIGHRAYAAANFALVLGCINGVNGASSSTNVGIGTTTPHAPLQFSNDTANRKIVLTESVNNSHQFYGFGVNTDVLRYQTPSTSSDHVFYAATSSTASTELARIKGNGDLNIAGKIINESWQSPASMLNSWVNFGSPYNNVQYYKDKENVVHLRGSIKSGTIGMEAFVLVANYRPAATQVFTVTSNGAFGSVEIASDGKVTPTIGSNTSISLDGISFRID